MKKKWHVTGQTGLGPRVNRLFRQGSDLPRGMFVGARRLRHFAAWQARARQRVVADPVGELRWRRGFNVLGPGAVPGADEVVAASLAAIAGGAPRLAAARKRFLANVLDAAELTLDSPFMRFALDPRVLRPIIDYLGLVPLLTNVSVFSSSHSGEDLKSSQLLHCDADDTRQVKIFVLCSAVAPANGPLTMFPADASRRIRRAVAYRYGARVTDDQATAICGPGVAEALVGAPGTVCFVDTSRCFHFGSRVEPGAAPRLVAMFQYLTPFAFTLPPDFHRGAPFRHLGETSADPVLRMVLGTD
jgi:hypothetical protein